MDGMAAEGRRDRLLDSRGVRGEISFRHEAAVRLHDGGNRLGDGALVEALVGCERRARERRQARYIAPPLLY